MIESIQEIISLITTFMLYSLITIMLLGSMNWLWHNPPVITTNGNNNNEKLMRHVIRHAAAQIIMCLMIIAFAILKSG